MFTFTRARAQKKTYKHIIFTLSCFLAHTNLSYRKIKIKRIRLARFELTLYLLYAIGPTPKPLHYSGRYCPTATHIGHSISNNLISSYIRRKLAKTTNNRSEIKLAYATPFELQGQKIRQYYALHTSEARFSNWAEIFRLIASPYHLKADRGCHRAIFVCSHAWRILLKSHTLSFSSV